MSDKPRILCIVGPTACHKTEAAIELALALNGEIVSADSVQVYIGMDVGSAKPTIEERRGVPHHMLDCVPINTPDFSVASYREMATAAIAGILSRGKLPIVVGGSGLYVSALTGGLNFAVPKDDDVRARMNALYTASPAAAYQCLQVWDPVTANRLSSKDQKRVVRALEVYACGGKPLSAYGGDFAGASGGSAPYEPIIIGLNMDREQLYRRIDLRVERMIERGLLAEAERIYRAGYDRALPAMQSIGYRQLFACFEGACTLAQAIERIQLDTRHFAKRQLTWFRRDQRTCWQDVTEYQEDTLRRICAAAKERLSTL